MKRSTKKWIWGIGITLVGLLALWKWVLPKKQKKHISNELKNID